MYTSIAAAGSLVEMPDTTEVPPLKKQTLLKDLNIPGVRDRNPDPQAGPRLNVTEFRIEGIVEYPELGITREALAKKVESIRSDMMQEGKLLDSGFTVKELGQVSKLLEKIEGETKGRHVGPLEVQRLVFLVRDQLRKRGITLGMIETVADTITRYYRERGFILAKAYIPEQKVRDGVVTLTVLLGKLGGVKVHNNTHYSDETIERIFSDAIGKPVTSQSMEEMLYFVNDLPGISAQGYFEPGAQVGDTRLNVNVTQDDRFDANVRIDNQGSDATGKNRLYAEMFWNNPLGYGDRIQLGVLNSFSPDNSLYGLFRYTAPVFTPKLQFSAGVSSNDYVLGSAGNDQSLALLGIEGTSTVYDESLRYIFERGRVENQSLALRNSKIISDVRFSDSSIGNTDRYDDTIRNLDLLYHFDLLEEKERILHQADIRLTASTFEKGAEVGQETSPYILGLDYTMLKFVKVPFTNVDSRLVSRVSLQYSGTSLSSINQFSLAGPTRARGFAINQFFADDAIYLGVDWIFRAPSYLDFSVGGESFDDIVQPFVFVDGAYGKSYSLTKNVNDSVGKLSDVGFGFKFAYQHKIQSNLTIAAPVTSDISESTGGSIDNGVKVYFDMTYSF